MVKLSNYKKIVGIPVIDEIKAEAEAIKGARVLNVNSTKIGGGVAVLLQTLIPLFKDVGINAEWDVIEGKKPFFDVTKNFHNGLQGKGKALLPKERDLYLKTNKEFAKKAKINHDCVIIHDPQPAACIDFVEKKQPWIWRCHIDLSNPDMRIWNFLEQYISRYDKMIIHNKDFMRSDLKIPQKIIMPSINPLDDKNMPMSEAAMKKTLSKYKIDIDKPIISQISRFDKWKDPVGVIKVFEKINKIIDCRLVLLGSTATDDPEGEEIFKNIETYANDDIIVINHDDIKLVNSLQTMSHVVFQKSIKEGFGLTVSEALWKKTPVIGGRVGGIRSQIVDGENGYLVNPLDYNECAKRAIEILSNDNLRETMGKNGHEHVKANFLTTNHLLNWIKTIKSVMK